MSSCAMSIQIKEINGKKYVYFIHYPNGRKTDVYCGADSKPESHRKALTLEIAETERRIEGLNERLADLIARRQMVC